MSESKKSFKMLAMVVFLLCVAAFYFGYGSHSEWVDFGFRLFNFFMFIALIRHFAGGGIKKFLRGRSEGIASKISGLENARTQASRRLKEVEAKIINLDKERQAIIAAYKAQGEAIKSEIIVKAEKNAKQIIAQAKLTAQSETDKAMRQMRAELAEEIFNTAEDTLRRKLDARVHEKIINKSLSRVVLN
ncbi:MAG: ATP synthase F0 subunit B [Deltaproteobacteria bacterium]|jgi:F-type H+-transporting ATPase subunit b|nr:ATP synthase F0 subunit B [Deltaproteobacteria bacterium]